MLLFLLGMLTHEEVVGVWVWSADLEKLHQIVELTMDIAAHRHRAFLLQITVSMLNAAKTDKLGVTYDWLHI